MSPTTRFAFVLAAALVLGGARSALAVPPEATYVGEKTCIKCHEHLRKTRGDKKDN